jgi:outer membrane receptor protein involved in Fe transport
VQQHGHLQAGRAKQLHRSVKLLAALALVIPSVASAQPSPPAPPASTQNVDVEPTAPGGLTDAELLQLSQGEVIPIYDQRPDKPFDRDTEVRLTGEQLAARGATDLGTALALLPDVMVRDAGRGGFNVDIRGARKGAVSVLVDGVLVTDPYYGTFDVSTIPITDIVQIRLSTTPQSPIDGPGGPGGVIEVVTRDAYGPQLVIARLSADSLPTLGLSATARVALAKNLALRVAATGLGGGREMPLPSNNEISEARHAATGSARLEYREGKNRIALDTFIDDRHYISPPDDLKPMGILMIDRESTQRVQAKADEQVGTLQLQEEMYYHHLFRRSRMFMDPALANQTQLEEMSAGRYGASMLATQPIGKELRWAASVTADHESGTDTLTTKQSSLGEGGVNVIEAAGDGQYEHKTVRLDAAVGVAIPFGVGANPWPEGKFVAKWRPNYGSLKLGSHELGSLELVATLARKGRVPSLRERFDPLSGNPALGPEKASHAELRAIETIDDRVRIEAAPFYKRTTGTIIAGPNMGQDINLGTVDFWGADVIARVRVQRMVEVGGAYDYVFVRQEAHDMTPAKSDPLDRLPRNRGEAWVQVTPEPRVSLLARMTALGWSYDQTVVVNGYALVGATATAQLSKEYLAVLRCDDLLNERPETRNGYHTAGRTISLVLQGQWR